MMLWRRPRFSQWPWYAREGRRRLKALRRRKASRQERVAQLEDKFFGHSTISWLANSNYRKSNYSIRRKSQIVAVQKKKQ